MSKDIKLKSYAKINISLNIISKEKYGNHKIESLFSFIDLYDEIFIKKIKSKNHKISFVGKYSKNIGKKNTVSKLMKILDKVILHNKMKYFIKINKKIPQKAGLGGGSMNAATVLNYFSRKRDKNYKIANIQNYYYTTKLVNIPLNHFNDKVIRHIYQNFKLLFSYII